MIEFKYFKSLLEMLVLAASIISVARVLKRGVKHLMSFLSLESTERGEIKPLPIK